ncbi:hypothetical protein YC2023_018433 [Brassica napus]
MEILRGRGNLISNYNIDSYRTTLTSPPSVKKKESMETKAEKKILTKEELERKKRRLSRLAFDFFLFSSNG